MAELKVLLGKLIAWALSLRLTRTWLHYSERRGPMLADSITYRALFSVFAGVLLGFSFAALWLSDDPAAWEALVDAVDAAIPGLLDLVDIQSIEAPAGLTVTGVISFVALIGAAIGAIGSLRSALRTLGDSRHDDMFWLWVYLRNLALAIAIGGGLALSAVVSFVGTSLVDATQDWLPAGLPTGFAPQAISLVTMFVLDGVLVALAFVALSGVKARPATILGGALVGAIGLTVLQQLSGLFVRGAASNPLLASFAALIALLLWFNLSSQVILIASTWIIVGVAERTDRVRERFGAPTFPLRRVRTAENVVRAATDELDAARDAAGLTGRSAPRSSAGSDSDATPPRDAPPPA